MCIRDRSYAECEIVVDALPSYLALAIETYCEDRGIGMRLACYATTVSYTHLRAHETVLDLVCRLLLEKKNTHGRNPHVPVMMLVHTTRMITNKRCEDHNTT